MIIVTRKKWKKTAKKLNAQLILQNSYKLNTIPNNANVLAWGVVEERANYNTAEAVRLCSNKHKCLQKLKEEGLQNLDSKVYSKKEVFNIEGPFIWREKPYGWGGKGIELHKSHYTLPPSGFIVQYIEKAEEYRVIVAFNKVLSVSRKVGDKDNHIVWNHKNGFTFIRLPWPEAKKVGRFAIKVARTLEIDVAGIDIIEDPGGNLYAIDINTAPGLEGLNLQKMNWILEQVEKDALGKLEGINFITMKRIQDEGNN